MGRTRRKKKRTQKLAPADGDGKKIPKTFVIERGKVGHILSQLVLDIRHIMEPHTASKLKVRHKNVLKDFVMVAGPLGVTHLLLVSHSTEHVNFKVCVLPRGPTLTFHVNAFSLAREVLSSQKKPFINPSQFLTPPMLVLSNFKTEEDKPAHLLSAVFQNMLPSINVHSVNLSTIRRCLLLHSDPDSKVIELRHYAIRVVAKGMSRGVKKLSRDHLPNLGRLGDISEYLLGGYVSESDGEELDGEGDVILPQDLPGRGNTKAQQSAVRLRELGPRMTLELVKIEAGLCGGEVLHHTFIQKTKKEKHRLHLAKETERKLKEKRRREQEANVARKRKEKEAHRARCLAGMGGGERQEAGEEESSEGEEDVEWFRKEVGQEPDPDTFGSIKTKVKHRKRQFSSGPSPKAKKMRHDTPSTGKRNPLATERARSKGTMKRATPTVKAKLLATKRARSKGMTGKTVNTRRRKMGKKS